MAGSQQGWRSGVSGGSTSGVQSVTGLNTDNTDPLNPIINISVDGVTITGDGTPLNPLVSVADGVQSVTGLDTDNTDPLNPIVNISVDGVTITGDGTPLNPLVSVADGVQSVTGLDTDNTDPANPIVNISVDGVTITGDGTPLNPLQAQYIPATNYGLYSQTANSTIITATTSELSLIGAGVGTLSVPANIFQVGDSFVAKLFGHITCVGTATIQIKVKSGSVLLVDTGIIALDVTTNKHWNIEVNFTIRSLGIASVGSIVSAGLFSYIKNSGLNFEGANFVFLNNTTFDTTILNTLDITAQWNTNNAGNNIYSDIFVLNKIY